MADRFYARFNLSREDFLFFKEEFDEFQKTRAEKIKKELPKETEALKNKSVLFIGDSITSDNLGYRICASLAANLDAKNGSLSSSTSASLLEKALKDIEDAKAEMVSIMIGTNDGISLNEPGKHAVLLKDFSENVRKLIAKAKECGSKILLFEIPLVEEKLFSDYFTARGKFQTNENVKAYNDELARIANEEKITLVAHRWLNEADLTPFFEPDGVHLSVMAQELFTKNWLHYAAKLI